MLKLAAQRLTRLLKISPIFPICALPLFAARSAHAQRPANAPTPPSSRPAPEPPITNEAAPRLDQEIPGARPSTEIEGGLEAFLDGRAGPVSLKLSEVSEGWKSMRVLRTGNSAPLPQSPTGPMNPDRELWNAILENFGGEPDIFLSRGRTLKLNGEDQLLVYRAEFPTQEAAFKWLEQRSRAQEARGPSQMSWGQVQRLLRDFLDTVPVRSSLLPTRSVRGFESIAEFRFEDRFARLSAFIEPEFRRSQQRRPSNGLAPAPVPPRPRPAPRPAPRVVPVPDAVAEVASGAPLKQLFAAVQRFRADNGDVLPALSDLPQAQAALSPYLRSAESWRDPVSGKLVRPNARLSGRRMAHLKPFASSLILFYSEPDPSGKRSVLRLDGVVRRVSPDEWARLSANGSVE